MRVRNRSIQPAALFNFADAVWVYNGSDEDLPPNTIVRIAGEHKGCIVVEPADSAGDTGVGVYGRLLFLKYRLPAKRRGVALPWRVVKGVDCTFGGVSGGTVGDTWRVGSSEDGTEGQFVSVVEGTHVCRIIARTLTPGVDDGVILLDNLEKL